jgi:hypothetical protein
MMVRNRPTDDVFRRAQRTGNLAHEAAGDETAVLMALIARFEGSGKSRRDFAADAGVGLAIFQYWLYKLRREREASTGRAASVPEVRLVPITVKARAAPAALIEVRVAGVRLRVPLGAEYPFGEPRR